MIVLEEKLYTSEETAEILGINPRTLYRYLKKGDIESETKTKSGTFRFSREQIYKYLYPDKYQKILELLRQKENNKYPYINNSALDNSNSDNLSDKISKPSTVEKNELPDNANSFKSSFQKPLQQSLDSTPTGVSLPTPPKTDINQVVLKQKPEDSLNLNLSKNLDISNINNTPTLKSKVDLADGLPTPQVKETPASSNVIDSSITNQQQNQQTNSDLEKIRNERVNKKLDDELENLESSIDNFDSPNDQTSLGDNGQVNSAREDEQQWKYYVNTNKDILQLAKDINSLNAETGRSYAATMHGGLSLHHNIDEFNVVHFYVEEDDLNWWVSHLELSYAKKEDANICLIPTADKSIFDSAYKLRGLNVVSDDRLIQDLMKHGEKELAKSLL